MEQYRPQGQNGKRPLPFRGKAASVAVWILLHASLAAGQVTTAGFLNLPRTEAPGTLLSHPVANGSEPIGRTTSLNYLNGWVVVGGEAPGSRPGSDLVLRVYDITDPTQPIRRYPSDFGLIYSNNRWYQGNVGWNAHGTAQYESLLLPNTLRVSSFGAPVELGGTNGVPTLSRVPIGYNRSSQAGPWDATLLWYGSPDQPMTIRQVYSQPSGLTAFRTLATFDHVGPFGGGEWHPIFFGDLLIYARSGGAARDGVVVYRLEYNDFENPETRSITPRYVGSLEGAFQGYWPNLFSDGTGLYVIGSNTEILMGADITRAADPAGDGAVTLAASLTVPLFTNASYPTYQDHFGFIHNRKVDMTRFLNGDPQPIVLTLDEAGTGVDTTQISLPLGNLWLTGGYPHGSRSQGMGVWVHQQAPDTTPPRVTYHIPQVNRTNYPRFAPLSFLLHEHSRAGGPRNGIDFLVRPVLPDESLGAPVPGFLIHDFSGTLTFTPTDGLAAETTYQVDFPSNPEAEIGFVDAAGNAIEPYSFRFSTGGGLLATEPPVITQVAADLYHPAPGAPVTVTATANGSSSLEYRFNFDGVWSAWGSANSATHVYPATGRPRVLVQVRDEEGNLRTDSLRLLVMTPVPSGPRPTRSSSIVVGEDPEGRRVWTVNPDSDTVAVLDAESGEKRAEHPVGKSPRSIARDATGRYWVTCHGSDEIRILAPDGTNEVTIPLAWGSAPFGIAPSPDGGTMFVTLYGSGQLLRFDALQPLTPPTVRSTFPTPRSLALSADGSRVFVTRFLSPELEAEVGEFAGFSSDLTFVRTIRLELSITHDGGDRAAGVPNYLAGIAISPDGQRAAVVSKQDNILRGQLFGVGDLTHETTVRAVLSLIDLTTNQEIRHTRRDFDNSESPSAVEFTPRGDMILVTLQGNNRVIGLDAFGLAPVSTRTESNATETSPVIPMIELATGLAPQGLAIDETSGRLFTQDFMGRSVTVRDASLLLNENRTSLPEVATTKTVAAELLSPLVLRGKEIFYNAADPRMSADSYLSCATCHIDGGHDGRVWDFTGRGEGLRRTTDLRGRSGLGHGNVHWSGNFDEIQDFEHDIRGPFGGTGFLPLSATEFATLHPSPRSGKTGLSEDLDALAAYVASLTPDHVPRSPWRQPNGALTAAGLRGRDVFVAQDCTRCHAGASLTDSPVGPVSAHPLEDVGTQSTLSGERLGGTLAGIDTPTLHGLHASRVFLHHGQAGTVEESLSYVGGRLLPAADATFLTTVNPSAVRVDQDTLAEGGGGSTRGVIGGRVVHIGNEAGATSPPGVRFSSVDGGTVGGPARIAIHYVRQYGDGTTLLRINGVQQTITMLRQYPDSGWHTGGWRWLTVETVLQPGPTNTIEILRGNGDCRIDVVLVSNGDDLARAEPHRAALSLSSGDRADLVAYLQQLDGHDTVGEALPGPPPPPAIPPSIVEGPAPATLAVGNSFEMHVVVAGTGPFTFQWRRNGIPVGTDSPFLNRTGVGVDDAGDYTVTVTNEAGSVTSMAASVVIEPALAVVTDTLPSGTVGQPYAATLEAIGGISSRTWSVVGGILPVGLQLSSEGELSGTVTAPARAAFTVQVADLSGTATRELALEIVPAGGFSTDPDLILHYTFDEGEGTQVWDSAVAGNNHATTVSNAHWVTDGRHGGAYGPSTANLAPNPFFPANQSDLNFDPRGDAFTISLWIRTTMPGTDGYRTIFDKSASNSQSQFRLWTCGSATCLQGITGWQYGTSLTASGLNDGAWHLVTMVNRLDGVTWRTRIYFDDGSRSVEYASGAGALVPNLMRIGDTSPGGNSWRGQIDDLRIYRRALTLSEVALLHDPPATPTPVWSASPTPTATATPTLSGPTPETPVAATPTATATATPTPTAGMVLACEAQPIVACGQQVVANTGSLTIDNFPTLRDANDRLAWTWKRGPHVSPPDFGNPVTETLYALCLYDGAGELVFGAGVPPGTAWKPRGAVTWRYADSTMARSGIQQIVLRASAPVGVIPRTDRSSIQVVARGRALNLGSTGGGNFPDLPGFPLVAEPEGLRVQLRNSLGHCWEGRFHSRVKRNDVDRKEVHRLRARSD